jgi:hypothetical protein
VSGRPVGWLRASIVAMAVDTVGVLPVFMTGALAVQLREGIGLSLDSLGLVYASYFVAAALFSAPLGHVAERAGELRQRGEPSGGLSVRRRVVGHHPKAGLDQPGRQSAEPACPAPPAVDQHHRLTAPPGPSGELLSLARDAEAGAGRDEGLVPLAAGRRRAEEGLSPARCDGRSHRADGAKGGADRPETGGESRHPDVRRTISPRSAGAPACPSPPSRSS